MPVGGISRQGWQQASARSVTAGVHFFEMPVMIHAVMP